MEPAAIAEGIAAEVAKAYPQYEVMVKYKTNIRIYGGIRSATISVDNNQSGIWIWGGDHNLISHTLVNYEDPDFINTILNTINTLSDI